MWLTCSLNRRLIIFDEFKQKLWGFFLVVVVSCTGFYFTAETLVSYEHRRRFSFANPVYIFNVLANFVCVAVGCFGFFELHRLTKSCG